MSVLSTISDVARRGRNIVLDREIRVGVTGLSRGGKTALITALTAAFQRFGSEGAAEAFPLFREYGQHRICYGGIASVRDRAVPPFPFRQAMDSLKASPPSWPSPTSDVSEIRLELRYHDDGWWPGGGGLRSLYVDIWDYPGEWLLDLMLLDMSYEDFSSRIAGRLDRVRPVADGSAWEQLGAGLDPLASLESQERQMAAAVAAYTAWLKSCKEAGLAMVVPGRFILPGIHAGARLLQFVPWIWAPPASRPPSGSLYDEMRRNYDAYREKVVRRFYRECFSHIDRQIVVIDCLNALMGGAETYTDLNETFEALLENFAYGGSSWWSRLFSPKIDRLIFAASKCDRVTNDEHPHMLSLLKSMVSGAAARVRSGGIEPRYMTLSAISAARCRQLPDGQLALFTDYPGERPFYPGTVPDSWSRGDMEFFRRGFKLRELRPPLLDLDDDLPHQRLDQLLSYLLGDKL